jgi:hypothetical protein
MSSPRPAQRCSQVDVAANRARMQADARLVRMLFAGTVGFWGVIIFVFWRYV